MKPPRRPLPLPQRCKYRGNVLDLLQQVRVQGADEAFGYAMIDHGVGEGFIQPRHARLLQEVKDVPAIFAALGSGAGVDAAVSFT